jgi:hypothetical protein
LLRNADQIVGRTNFGEVTQNTRGSALSNAAILRPVILNEAHAQTHAIKRLRFRLFL